MNNDRFCQYGKEIKKKLVDVDKTQEWLIEQVKRDTGLYFDSSYLYKILAGKISTPKIVTSINKILGLKYREQEKSRPA